MTVALEAVPVTVGVPVVVAAVFLLAVWAIRRCRWLDDRPPRT